MAKVSLKSEGLDRLKEALSDYPDDYTAIAQRKLLGVAEIAAAAAARRLPQSRGFRTVTDRNGRTRQRKKGNNHPDHVHARDTITVKKSGKANVVIQAGSARGAGQHFGWLDFGGTIRPNGKAPVIKRPTTKEGRYIYPAAADNAGQMKQALSDAADEVTRRLGLD